MLSVCSVANWPTFQMFQLAFHSCVISHTCCRWSMSYTKHTDTNKSSKPGFNAHLFNVNPSLSCLSNALYHTVSNICKTASKVLKYCFINTCWDSLSTMIPMLSAQYVGVYTGLWQDNSMSLMLHQTFSSVQMLLEGGCSILKKPSPLMIVFSSCFSASSWLRCSTIWFKANSVLSALSNGPGYSQAKK